MKYAIYLRLFFGLSMAIFIFVASLRASLDAILAPLPGPDVKISLSSRAGSQQESRESAVAESETEAVLNGILASDVVDELTTALEDRLRTEGEITLVPLRELPDLSSYSHPFMVTLMNVPNRLSRGNILLRYQVENEQGILGEWSIPFRSHLYSDVWFAQAQLRRGDIATPSDFVSRRVDMLQEPNAVPASLELLLRHEYSRDIAPGKPLLWSDLTGRSMIRKGSVVEVSAVNGLLAITMRAIARQDGTDGDIILLRNIDSAKEFSARVTGENRAEVIF
jgi:flagella basal body P-ring formation protein FlgA